MMNFLHSLTFVWTPWSLALAIGGGIVAAGYCFAAWQRSGFRRSVGMLEALAAGDRVPGRGSLQPAGMGPGLPPRRKTVGRRPVGRFDEHGNPRLLSPAARAVRSSSRATQAIAPLKEAAAWKLLDEKMNVFVESRFLPRRQGAAATCTSRWPRPPKNTPTSAAWCSCPTATGTKASRRCRPRCGCGLRESRSLPSPSAVPPGSPMSTS